MNWTKTVNTLVLTALGLAALSTAIAQSAPGPEQSAPVDKYSVKSIEAFIAQKTKEADALAARANAGEPINPQAIARARKAAEWWEAYLWDYKLKAYPNDRVDFRKYIEGMRHRARMPAAPIQRDPRDHVGGNWAFVGPRNLDVPYQTYWGLRPVSGRVSAIAISAQDTSVWYVAGATGGVFLTTDGGATYSSRSGSWDMLEVSSLECDPSDGNILYAGTGDHAWGTSYGMGIMKTTNGGSSWTNVGRAEMEGNAVSDIEVWDASPNVVLASCGRGADGVGQVWRSTDSGSTWTAVITTLADWHEISHGAVSGGYRNVWAVGTSSGSLLIRRSQNFGSTWTAITPPAGASGIGSVAASKVDRDTVYLLSCGNNSIYKSTNAGSTWTDISSGFPNGFPGNTQYNWSQDSYDWYIECGRTASGEDLVIVGLISLAANRGGTANNWVSVGGETWSGSNLTHNDQHSVCLHPTVNDRFFFGNDGGFYSASYVGFPLNTWLVGNYNERLPITHFYEFDTHPTDGNFLIGGTQDNATPASRGDLNNWDNVVGGDGGGCAINQSVTNRQYGTSQRYGYDSSTQQIRIGRTTDGWATRSDFTISSPAAESRPFIGQLVLTPGNQNVGYVGTNYLKRFTDTGGAVATVAQVGGFNFGSTITAIAVAPSNANRIYVGLNNGDIWTTANGGTTWDQIDNEGTAANQLPNRAVTSFAINAGFDNQFVVTMAGFGSGTTADHVFRTTDADAEPVNWIRANGSGSTALPNVPHRSIVRDPYASTSILYVANDLGVFYSDDFGGTWYEMTTSFGLPNVQVRELNINTGNNYLYAATWGRGAYRMPLVSGHPTVASINAPTSVLGGNYISCRVTLSRDAAPGGQAVNVTSSNTALIPNFSVVVPGGSSSVTRLFIQTEPPLADTNVTLSAGGQTDVVLVEAVALTGHTLAPNDTTGGNNVTGTVTIDEAAPRTGIVINVNEASPLIAAPTTVTIPMGDTSATYTINTVTPTVDTSVTVSAVYQATLNRTLILRTVNASTLTLSPNTVAAGQSSTATLTLDRAAPLGGTTVAITSSNPSAAWAPASIVFSQGQTSRTFTVSTGPVAAITVANITANPPGSNLTSPLTVTPVNVSGTITLEGVTPGAVFVRPVEFRVWDVGAFPPAASPRFTYTQNLTFNSGVANYTVPVGYVGRMEMSAKTSHWLRERIGPFIIPDASGITGQNFFLINGDVNGDNVVDLADFLELAATYEVSPPSNPAADLNEDGSVDLADFLILAANYDIAGEE
jgi:hypothetical protein